MKRIDFYITNNRHHLEMILPVIRILKENRGVQCRIISFCEFRRLQTPVELIEKQGIACVIMPGLKVRGVSASSGSEGLGGNKSMLRNFLRELIWFFLLRKAVIKVIDEGPDLVVVPNDISYPLTKPIHILKRRKIPFILFQEGIRFPLPNEFEDTMYGTNGASAIFAWGNHSKRYFENISSSPVRALGNPRLDEKVRGNAGKKPSRDFPGATKILYVSNPVDDQGFCSKTEKIALLTRFLSAYEEYFVAGQVTILVKLHGRENEGDFRKVLNEKVSPVNVIFVNSEDLFTLFNVVNAVVVLASTAGLEAMLLGRPVGVIKLPGHGYVFDYVREQAALGLDLDDAEPRKIKSLLEDWMGSELNCSKKFTEDQISNLGSAASHYSMEIVDFLKKTN